MLCAACKHPLLPCVPPLTQMQELLELDRFWTIPSDLSDYESAISTSIAALATYDSTIQTLQETLQSMLADRSKVKTYWSVIAPVRRLPSEILCEVFALLSLPSGNPRTQQQELDNLSKSQLLRISGVCTAWHNLIMGTPKLWSDIAVDIFRWLTTADSVKFINGLKTCLQLGEQHPLTLTVHLNGDPYSLSETVLELLAEHSNRWDRVFFVMTAFQLNMLRRVMGKLDALRSFRYIFFFQPDCAIVPFCPKLPWRQLRTFTYKTDGNVRDFSPFIAVMGNLSHPEAAFQLHAMNDRLPTLTPGLSPIESTISFLLVDLSAIRDPQPTSQGLGDALGRLTLRYLRELRFICTHYPGSVMFWPVSQFETFAARSSFQDTLRILEIPSVVITEDELVRSLACTCIVSVS
ncbi:hypothetical protein B0H19DRAFT_1382379 [Mycena capillaripes]|nr:hypothetical protein B0H19DRAFT_1382379 [Mycena capillaripes]